MADNKKWVEAITNTSSLPGTSGIVSLNCITKVKAEGDVIDREREPSPIQRSRSEINRPRGRSASRSRSGSRSPSAQKMQAYEKLVEKVSTLKEESNRIIKSLKLVETKENNEELITLLEQINSLQVEDLNSNEAIAYFTNEFVKYIKDSPSIYQF